MRQIVLLLAAMLLTPSAFAADSEISVTHAWARATAPGQETGMLQFTMRSQQHAQLLAISSSVAQQAELHSMTHENGTMKMRALKSIELNAGEELDLAKNGQHVMLLKLKHPLRVGDSVPFTLKLQLDDKHQITVKAVAEVSMHAPHPMP